jgi:hypothetical protein
MHKVGDLVKAKTSAYNFRITEVRDNVLVITSPRHNENLQFIVQSKDWKLDESYYRKKKIELIKEKICSNLVIK